MMEINETENFIHVYESCVSVKKVKDVILPLFEELDCELIDTDWGRPKEFFRCLSECEDDSRVGIDLLYKKRGKSWQSTL